MKKIDGKIRRKRTKVITKRQLNQMRQRMQKVRFQQRVMMIILIRSQKMKSNVENRRILLKVRGLNKKIRKIRAKMIRREQMSYQMSQRM